MTPGQGDTRPDLADLSYLSKPYPQDTREPLTVSEVAKLAERLRRYADLKSDNEAFAMAEAASTLLLLSEHNNTMREALETIAKYDKCELDSACAKIAIAALNQRSET